MPSFAASPLLAAVSPIVAAVVLAAWSIGIAAALVWMARAERRRRTSEGRTEAETVTLTAGPKPTESRRSVPITGSPTAPGN